MRWSWTSVQTAVSVTTAAVSVLSGHMLFEVPVAMYYFNLPQNVSIVIVHVSLMAMPTVVCYMQFLGKEFQRHKHLKRMLI